MKLLFATTKNPWSTQAIGGAETSIRLLATKLAQRGHECHYMADTADAQQIASALQDGVILHGVLAPGQRGGARGFQLLKAFWRIIRGERIELAYCFYELRILRALLRIRRLQPRLRVVMRMAGLRWQYEIERKRRRAATFQRAFSEVDAVNFIHSDLVDMVGKAAGETGIAPNIRRHFTLDIGVDLSKIGRQRSREPDGQAGGGPFDIVMVSRFTPYQKRQDILLDALLQVPADVPIRLTFVGEGERRESLSQTAERHGLSATGRVAFEPFQPQADLWARLTSADLVCHCVDYEGLGKSVIEAMALGCPVLASDVSPLRSYIEDGETGFLAENEPGEWARRLATLAGQPAELAAVGARARAFARAHFDAEINAQAYEDAFGAIVAGKPLPEGLDRWPKGLPSV